MTLYELIESTGVKAAHQKSNEQVTVIDGLSLSGPHNGADAHTPSMMSLPRSGME